ncbi:sigma-70 family RNA polymerase sigma factor [Anaerovorax odorimutans]|uniref:RNA polymerase sigma factor n=1 Tax=Anaerovorax odorimutans TaxID=109327 RepID=A0ABT1RSC4_9FIRM|nr:sigma-70 family RNA polymerase sigma factor [Anaerovorax odorimutans]MCQ4638099.1 sigma-70 family RNA polymerase sigma factor [Anaerovorax odorimutans]
MASKYVPVKKEDTYALIERAQQGDEEAREQIVNQNTGLVKNLALKFTGSGYELDDLLQIGFMGLLKAIDRFDTGFDVMFSTYAVPMILGEIKRYIRDDGKIKVSRQLKMDIRNLKRLKEEYYNKNGTWPKLSYLAEEMEMPVEKILEILDAGEALANVESLDNSEISEGYREKKVSHVSEEERNIDMIDLKMIIGTLSDRERQIIVLRYFKDMTQQQIAGKMGISQVQVSRIEKKVLKNMREKMAE